MDMSYSESTGWLVLESARLKLSTNPAHAIALTRNISESSPAAVEAKITSSKAYGLLGRIDDAKAVSTKATQLAESIDDSRGEDLRISAKLQCAHLDSLVNNYADAMAGYEACLSVAKESNDQVLHVKVSDKMIYVHYSLGEYDRGFKVCREALELHKALDSRR